MNIRRLTTVLAARFSKKSDKFINPTMAESFGERLDKDIGDKFLDHSTYLKDAEYVDPKTSKNDNNKQSPTEMPEEYGYKPKGLEPTRYGDWERNGRCFDF